MDMHKGKKDGEVKIFRNGINPEAYAWKELSQKWEKLGDVVSQPPKKYYEGDKFFPKGEYDYIFNVEVSRFCEAPLRPTVHTFSLFAIGRHWLHPALSLSLSIYI